MSRYGFLKIGPISKQPFLNDLYKNLTGGRPYNSYFLFEFRVKLSHRYIKLDLPGRRRHKEEVCVEEV